MCIKLQVEIADRQVIGVGLYEDNKNVEQRMTSASLSACFYYTEFKYDEC